MLADLLVIAVLIVVFLTVPALRALPVSDAGLMVVLGILVFTAFTARMPVIVTGYLVGGFLGGIPVKRRGYLPLVWLVIAVVVGISIATGPAVQAP